MDHCSSCKREVDADNLMPAMTFSWELIPGRKICRNADYCFEAWLAAGCPESDPLPVDWKPSR